MTELGYNPQEELDRIEAITDLFTHSGWELFLEDMRNNLNAVSGVKGIDGAQSLGIRQGQVQVLEGVLSYESLIEATASQIREDIAATDSEDEEDA